MTNPSILIVEDEKDLSDLICFHLKKESFESIQVFSGGEVFPTLNKKKIDLIILDIMLPQTSGLELCRSLRANPSFKHIPILILSAKSEEIDRIIGLEMGADDYLTKPFSARELILRIKSLLKRAQPAQSNTEESDAIHYGKLKLDLNKHKLFIDQQAIPLTVTEFKLVECFLKSKGRILTREILLDSVWGNDIAVGDRTIDTHLKRLREKLLDYKEMIETVRGVGYRLKEV